MYELVKVAKNTYYIDCPAKIGVYVEGGKNAWLIDSGSDKDAGRRVLKILREQGWEAAGIINTHSNADHCGGNSFIHDRTGCRIFSSDIECAIERSPVLEPSFLYGGYPMKELRNKFLMAQPSPAQPLFEGCLPEGFETLPLPGHFFGQLGVKTPDRVWFLADCLFSRETIEKYHIFFVYDAAAFLDTLDVVERLEGAYFVPSHAPAGEDMGELIVLNRSKVIEISGRILDICREPKDGETVLKEVFDGYGLSLNMQQYVLAGSTVRSFLSWLSDNGKLRAVFQDNRLLWKTV